MNRIRLLFFLGMAGILGFQGSLHAMDNSQSDNFLNYSPYAYTGPLIPDNVIIGLTPEGKQLTYGKIEEPIPEIPQAKNSPYEFFVTFLDRLREKTPHVIMTTTVLVVVGGVVWYWLFKRR